MCMWFALPVQIQKLRCTMSTLHHCGIHSKTLYVAHIAKSHTTDTLIMCLSNSASKLASKKEYFPILHYIRAPCFLILLCCSTLVPTSPSSVTMDFFTAPTVIQGRGIWAPTIGEKASTVRKP